MFCAEHPWFFCQDVSWQEQPPAPAPDPSEAVEALAWSGEWVVFIGFDGPLMWLIYS